MNKSLLICGALLGMTGVVLGAFGAHALKNLLSPERINSFETGVRYQMIHALAVLLVALIAAQLKNPSIHISGWLFVFGVFLFSGSIYLLACRDVIGISSYKWLGPITPLGGTLLIIGWAYLIFSFFKIE